MKIRKNHLLLRLGNSYIIDLLQPSNLRYAWSLGLLLPVCIIIQIVTGVTLAMHYNPSVSEAFNSVKHIIRNVNNGWLIRYLHADIASVFFFLVYLYRGKSNILEILDTRFCFITSSTVCFADNNKGWAPDSKETVTDLEDKVSQLQEKNDQYKLVKQRLKQVDTELCNAQNENNIEQQDKLIKERDDLERIDTNNTNI